MKNISIFIPAYDAQKTVRFVIERIPAQLWQSVLHVYLINDGSRDQTAEVNAEIAKEYPQCVPLEHKVNLGYGETVKHGLCCCRADGCDYAVCLHADGQYPPELIGECIEKMETERKDLLQGSRIASGTALSGGMPLYKYVCGRMMTALENRVFGLGLTDYHSGFLLYSRRILNSIALDGLSGSFEIDLEIIASACASGYAIGEFPIPTRYAGEKSYLNPIRYGFNVLRVLMRYATGKYRDMLQPYAGGA